jgi:molecular chaperone GrpE
MSDDQEHIDIDFESDEELGDAAALHQKIKNLRVQLKEAQAKRDEYLVGWQREKADAINTKKDSQYSAQRAIERAKDAFIESLLPALDSFDMAISSESWDNVAEEWKSGMGRIHSQLLDVLQKNGVRRFGESNEVFDPSKHEAVQEVDDGSGESHTVLKILRHGYADGDRVIRPAQVVVRK